MDFSKYSANYIGHCLISNIQNKNEGIIHIIDTGMWVKEPMPIRCIKLK